mmetsp:Transcript_44457/g.135500  ORF Transcript_44457/g.135500 Transcript_44457/m.135500 type:complete len:511 (-) Transcript_44457:79-1611(-)
MITSMLSVLYSFLCSFFVWLRKSSALSRIESGSIQPNNSERHSNCVFRDGDATLLQTLASPSPVDWDAVRKRIAAHPGEVSSSRTPTGQTPLCAAIDRDAPPRVIEEILSVHPRAARELVHWHSRLTPLYLAVARGASPDVVRLILDAYPAAASRPVFNGCLPLHASREIKTARMLIEAYPGGVGWRNEQGYLPLHRVSYAADSKADVVELLIEEGIKQNLGGKNGGGGVFLETAQGITPLSAVCCTITGGLEADEFRSISDVSFLSRSAQIKWSKLEAIVRAASEVQLSGKSNSFWPWRNPVGVADQRERKEKFHLLHSVIELNCPLLVVSFALRTNPTQSVELDVMGRSALSLAVQSRDTCGPITCLLLDSKQGGNPGAALVLDGSSRLPLHHAIQSGRGYDKTVRDIIRAAPKVLEIKDGKSGVYPFMMATMGSNEDVNLTFALLRKSPWLVRNCGMYAHAEQLQTGMGMAGLTLSCLLLPLVAVILHFVVQVIMETKQTPFLPLGL